MFVEQTKVVLADAPAPVPVRVPAAAAKAGWMAWLRPAFAAPLLALLLAVIAYQNIFQVPHLEQASNRPLAVPYASLNVSTRGTVTTQVATAPNQGFNLLVSIPPDKTYSSYKLDLYNPAGRLQWSLSLPASSSDDTRSIFIPGAGLAQGIYNLAVSGITTTGQSANLGNYPVELQIQK